MPLWLDLEVLVHALRQLERVVVVGRIEILLLGRERFRQSLLRRGQRVVGNDDVRRYAAPAVDESSGVRLVGRPILLHALGFRRRIGLLFDEMTILELSLLLNRAAARSVPLRRRELEGVAAVEIEDGLHKPLAETGLAE